MSLGIVLGMLPSKYFIYHPFFILRFPPQIWRFATSFLITGSGLGLVFDTYFLYSYLSQMEVGNPRFPRKEDLIWYLVFVCGTILVSSHAQVLPIDFRSWCTCFEELSLQTQNPSYICPDSVVPLLLSRFLEMRKRTPALRFSPLFAGLFRGVGMVGCLMDGSCDPQIHSGGFIAPYIFITLSHSFFFTLICFCLRTCRRRERIEADSQLQVANHFVGFGFMMFLPALILALSYTVTQDQRGAKVSYMFVTMPAQMMPYAMLAINLLFPGGVENMILQFHGLFAGHLFDFLSRTWPQYGGGRNLIPTPAILSRIVQSTESLFQTGVGGPARPAGRTLGGGTGANTSSGPLPDSWRTRGPGQRLG